MEDLLNKIRALYTVNEEIIERVGALQEVLHYEYVASLKDGLVLEEVPSAVKVADILKDFKFEAQLVTDIWDVFNDKPNWQAKGWDDLKRLNRELFAAAEKFALLDKNNARAATELAKHLQNFELLQTSLGAVEEKTLSDKSRQDKLAEVNRLLTGLKLDGAQFVSPVSRKDFRTEEDDKEQAAIEERKKAQEAKASAGASAASTTGAGTEEKSAVPEKKGYRKIVLRKGDKTNFPKKGESVSVRYTGMLENGQIFDTNVGKKKSALKFKVGMGKVIRGWDEAVLEMSKGEKAKITIEPDWAYGAKGVPGTIPPNSTLIFEVELEAIGM